MKKASIIPILKFQNGSLPFKVQTIKDFMEAQDDVNEGTHSHNHYEMIWLIKGQGVLDVDMQERTIDSNTIFCLKPNQPHQFRTHPEMEGFVFSFTDSFFSMDEYDFHLASQVRLSQLFAAGRTIRVAPDMEDDMKEIVLKMIKESVSDYSYGSELLKRYFKIFQIYLTRRVGDEKLQSTERSREAELIQCFMELLDKNFKEKKMVFEYAAELSVTPNYLNGIIKKNTGFSAGHHIRQRVVLEAKRLGWYSDAGMKEIAYSLGFEDSSHFSKFFKAVAGMNFSEFKRGAVIIPLNVVFNRA